MFKQQIFDHDGLVFNKIQEEDIGAGSIAEWFNSLEYETEEEYVEVGDFEIVETEFGLLVIVEVLRTIRKQWGFRGD